jgi:hypothetical protein
VQVPIEFVALFLTPLLTALGTLFWLVMREKDNRLRDKEQQLERMTKTVDSYRDQTIPALDNLQASVKTLADLFERTEDIREYRRGSYGRGRE